MGDETGQATVGFMWHNLDDVISTVRLGLGRDLAHSLSLSMGVRESKNHLKVKQKRK